jgi:exodeoxyribonuclease VII small subunit
MRSSAEDAPLLLQFEIFNFQFAIPNSRFPVPQFPPGFPAGRSSPHDISLHVYFCAMAKRNQVAPKTFEEALQELEQILSDMEGGQVGLEESIVKYERGSFLIQHCRAVLGAAEKQIELLTKAPDGSLAAEPLPEAAGEV